MKRRQLLAMVFGLALLGLLAGLVQAQGARQGVVPAPPQQEPDDMDDAQIADLGLPPGVEWRQMVGVGQDNYRLQRRAGSGKPWTTLLTLNKSGNLILGGTKLGLGRNTRTRLQKSGGQVLELYVNNLRALRLEPNASSPNVISGHSANNAAPGVVGASIGGGGSSGMANSVTGDYGTVGGGYFNAAAAVTTTIGGGEHIHVTGEAATVGGGSYITVTGDFATVGGGGGHFVDYRSGLAVWRVLGNQALGDWSTVGGGGGNIAEGYASVVGGGGAWSSRSELLLRFSNVATGTWSTVSGGGANTASNGWATVGGGLGNTASGPGAVVGGGGALDEYGEPLGNSASGENATVGGGAGNRAAGQGSVVGGGGGYVYEGGSFTAVGSVASGEWATVGGGRENNAGGLQATIGGGASNRASGSGATVAGGSDNRAQANNATIGGGWANRATAGAATIGGGNQNRATAEHATVGGGRFNYADALTATIGGGESINVTGQAATVAGGSYITVTGDYAAVGGGQHSTASDRWTTVGGGMNNTASARSATVGGGIDNTASGNNATVGGGHANSATGPEATVPGGGGNLAQGAFSFAAGRDARALHDGAFVWSDSIGTAFASERNNQFRVRATGGARFNYNNNRWVEFYDSGSRVINTQTTAYLSSGGIWSNASDRELKQSFADVDARDILARVAQLPIQSWGFVGEEASVRHLGPTAQDFYAAFGLGYDDQSIPTLDADGVALAAIQALAAENAALRQQVADLAARLAALEAALAQ